LVVCRGLSEIDLLQRFQPQPHCGYIVASDDIRVHLEKGKYPWVEAVCYLEQMESFYPVAADVIKFVEPINQWLESLEIGTNGIPKELLFWIRACEGGKTTQRIQDLLLLIRSYCHLLETYDISSIVILSHPQAEWEDRVLTMVGRRKGIEVQILGRFRPGIMKAKLLAWMKLLAREPYYISYILLAKLQGHLRPDQPRISGKEIIMQLCSSEGRHIGNIVPLMKALKKRGYSPVVLQWRASEARNTIQREGLEADELETFCPGAALWSAPFRVWRTWHQASRKRHEFFSHADLHYGDIPLGPLLWPSMQAFFGEELAQRYRLQQAARRYFASHCPQAMRVWGGGVLPEGAIVLKSLQDKQKPLKFFWIMNYFDNPYMSNSAPIDLFLASGDSQKKYLEKVGVPSRRIVSVGLSRYDHLAAFQKRYTQFQSRAYLNIPQDYQYSILFDSNYALRGYITIQEISLVTNALLNFVREHPSVALLIKPHPAHRPGWLEDFLDYFSLPNVYLIDKNMLPFHALNAADLIITKFSTIALEAMLFKRPVVSILLDGGERFRIYGDAVECANSLEALQEILSMVVGDARRRAAWVQDQLENQARFLKSYFRDSQSESALLGAEALDKFLRKNRSGKQIEG
jgi:hypothetical protein